MNWLPKKKKNLTVYSNSAMCHIYGGLALLANILYKHLNSRELKKMLIKSLIPVHYTDDNSLLCFPLAFGSCLFRKYPICSAEKRMLGRFIFHYWVLV